MLEKRIFGSKTFSNVEKHPQDPPLKFNLPTFGDILYRLRPPEVSHFRSNRFDADIAGSIPIDGIRFSWWKTLWKWEFHGGAHLKCYFLLYKMKIFFETSWTSMVLLFWVHLVSDWCWTTTPLVLLAVRQWRRLNFSGQPRPLIFSKTTRKQINFGKKILERV